MNIQIARPGNPSRQIDLATGEVRQRFVALDRYAEEGYVEPQGLPTLAKISAGYKGDDGLPKVSRDGTIYITDPDNRAPNLRKALQAADQARRDDKGNIRKIGASFEPMRLQIALPFNEIDDNLRQSFVRYSAGRLEAQGTLEQITELVVTEWDQSQHSRTPKKVERHTAYRNGEACPSCDRAHSYQALKESCQVVWNLLFTLGEWVGEGDTALAKPIMPDGLGVYRLTSASRKGLNDIGQYLDLVAELCHGRLRGIVLDLMLTYPLVFDPLGVRRNQVPRWTLLFKPPAGIVLDPRRWAALAAGSLAEGAFLALPAAPAPERWDEIERDMAELVEPEAQVLDQLLSGDLPAERNADYWRREYFGNVQGTSLATDTGRAVFLRHQTGMSHLPEVIAAYSNRQMEELVARAAQQAAHERLAVAGVRAKVEDRPAGGELDAETIDKARKYDQIMNQVDQAEAALSPPRPAPESAPPRTTEAPHAAVDAGAAAAEPSPPPPADSPAGDGEGDPAPQPEVDIDGRPVDIQPESDGSEPASLQKLLTELRPDMTGGEIFQCGACGKPVGSVRFTRPGSTDEEILPARTWLAELDKAGFDRPLCRDDARKELAARRRKERAS